MRDLELTFDDLHQIYLNQIASSFEKSYGRTYLGEELSCFSFWLLHDQENKGYFNLAEAGKLLRTLKFDRLFVNDNAQLED
jgi:hypothetical protein